MRSMMCSHSNLANAEIEYVQPCNMTPGPHTLDRRPNPDGAGHDETFRLFETVSNTTEIILVSYLDTCA